MTEYTYDDRDFDAMPGRGLAARWVLKAMLRLETAAHFGGQSDSALDMPILRCARTGQPLLPGASLGGALRAYLLDHLAGYGTGLVGSSGGTVDWKNVDQGEVSKAFGGARTDDAGSQSPLIVFDTLGRLPTASAFTEVRDGVMIDTATGIAANHKKFDFEVLPPGTTFDVRFDVLVPDGADEGELLSLLCASLEGLGNGDIRVGLRRSRGLGEVSCDGCTARRYDLSAQEGWLEWIGSDYELCPDMFSGKIVRNAIQSAMPSGISLSDVNDKRERIVIEAVATVLGDLLIRSPNAHADGPDVMHLASGGRPVVTGTSLTGVIRAQALRIVQLVHGVIRDDAESHWITPMFGPREESTSNSNFQPRGSRLRVSERPVSNGQPQRVTRVAIDRFTQGVVPTALFDEQPHLGGAVNLRFELHNPHDGEVGLLLLVLKDLLAGQLPIGGTASVGRGVLIGQRMTVEGSSISKPIEVTFDQTEARHGGVPTSDELNKLVKQFVQTVPAIGELEGTAS